MVPLPLPALAWHWAIGNTLSLDLVYRTFSFSVTVGSVACSPENSCLLSLVMSSLVGLTVNL